jgi:hypothetical protein
MLYKSNYTNKAISAVLLVLLLFIHSIKLLHKHPGNNSFSNHNCNGNCLEKNDNSDFAKSSSDCSICSYQLSKDADDLVYPTSNICKPEQQLFNTQLISFHKFSFHTAFENRGPPSEML